MLCSLLKICKNEMRVIFSTCLLCVMLFMMIHTPLTILYILCRIVYMFGLSTYGFSTLYTTLPHNLIKIKLIDLIERTFYKKEGELYIACNDKKAFFTSKDHYKGYHLWSCQNVCDALSFLLDNIYIRFGTK